MTLRLRKEQSRIARLVQAGSTKILFPHPRGDACEAVWLNTAGGITGGDDFALDVDLEDAARGVLTTQAAERIYRAVPGPAGRVANTLTLGPGAEAAWLPQETILFDGAALDRTLRIDMAGDARFLGCETLIFGRAAMGESVSELRLRDRIDLRVDGRLAYADRLWIEGDAAAELARAHVAAGARAVATLVLARPGAAAALSALRADLPATAGASALSDDLVTARLVAADGFEMRRVLVPLLARLSGRPLPRPWMI
ncbi:urease accessory protein ureD [Roseivivax isoporae LMG 25204]|uniref:Urease accessory protein UreD n=1 Tax=Roseivivax isoporae LMG 25204 TaxID=1449351 RepID=X7FBL0_9RHOB|nr:urease accessory protein ureD [Roseivivax isoporae LMG 25204]